MRLENLGRLVSLDFILKMVGNHWGVEAKRGEDAGAGPMAENLEMRRQANKLKKQDLQVPGG